jgi:hypothetical protein
LKRKKGLQFAWSVSLILTLVFFASDAKSQDLGSWNVLNAKFKINQKWSVFGEAQLRSVRFYTDYNYHEYKGGFNFQPQKGILFTLGTGKYDTYGSGGNFVIPKNRSEVRLWPQVQFNQQLNAFKIENRLRAEFRFSSSGYRNRFRNRIGAIYPLLKNKEGRNVLEIAAYNEIFFYQHSSVF